MYSQLDPDDYNFRILTGTVREAVQGTVCAAGLPEEITEKPRWPPRSNFEDNNSIDGPNDQAKISAAYATLAPSAIILTLVSLLHSL